MLFKGIELLCDYFFLFTTWKTDLGNGKQGRNQREKLGGTTVIQLQLKDSRGSYKLISNRSSEKCSDSA